VKSFAGRVLLLMIVVMLLPVSEPGAYAAPAEKQPQPAPTQSPSPGAQAPQAPKEPPASIPSAEVSARANEVVNYLRTLERDLEPSRPVVGIDRALPDISARLDDRTARTRETLDSGPGLATLDALVDAWQSSRVALVAWIDTLTTRAVWLEQQRQRLAELRETWARTRADIVKQRAPAQVVARVDEVLASVAAAQKRVDVQNVAILVLQDQVAKELARCDDALNLIDRARRRAAGALFVLDSPPIWKMRPEGLVDLPGRIEGSFAAQTDSLVRFVKDQSERIVVHVVLFLVLVAALWWTRTRARVWAGEDGAALPALPMALERPVASGAVLAVLASPWIYSGEPRTAWLLLEAGALLAMVAIFRRLVAPRLVPWVYGLGAFFLAYRLRELFTALPLLERTVFLLEMLVPAALIGWVLRTRRWHEVVFIDALPSPFTRVMALRAAFAAFTVAFVSGAVGNMSLARLLASSTLQSAYVGLILAAGRRIAEGLFDLALRLPPLRFLRMVQQHRAYIEQRAHRLLRTVALAVWAAVTLDSLGLLRPMIATGRTIWAAELTRGALQISVGDVLSFVVTVWAAFFVSSLVRFVLQEDVFPRLSLGAGLPYALSSLVSYAIVTVGFIVALLVLGVNLDRVTVLGGAFGVGVGFGLQNVVNNFVSGLIVLFERPVHIGDEVQIGNVQGQVRRIGFRSTTIRIGEGAEVIVPNSQLVAERVTNWTPIQRLRRLDIQVNVSYGTAPDMVLKVLVGAAQAQNDIAGQPAPQAFFLGFGDSALRFELQAWTHRLDALLGVKSDLGVSVYAALRDAGMAIALPQQEVHLRRE